MKRTIKVILVIALAPIALVALGVVAVIAYLFWPRHATESVITSRLAERIADGVDPSVCSTTTQVRLVHPDYAKKEEFDGRYGSNPDTKHTPFAKVKLTRWSKSDKGTGAAHVEGKTADWYDMHLLSSAPCVVDITFDYVCSWEDNGNARRWACEIENIQRAR